MADAVSWQGRDPYGAPVHTLLPRDAGRAGLMLPVRISRALRHSLVAETMDGDPCATKPSGAETTASEGPSEARA